MSEGIAEPRHALTEKFRERKDDRRARVDHRRGYRARVVDEELKHDRRATERRRCVAVPGSRFLRDGERDVSGGEIGMADAAFRAVFVTSDDTRPERAHVEVERVARGPNDE